jgi:hypothetical protein
MSAKKAFLNRNHGRKNVLEAGSEETLFAVAAGSKSLSSDHASLICEIFHKVFSPLISREI